MENNSMSQGYSLTYASDDISHLKKIELILLKLAKKKGFFRNLLFKYSKKTHGRRNDLARLYAYRNFGLRVGKYTYQFNHFCNDDVLLKEIGAFCSIPGNVTILPSTHPLDTVSTHPAFYLKKFGFLKQNADKEGITHNQKRAVIGHDVWIGSGAAIMNHVIIGTGAVIGAGAIVTKDVEPYAIVAGVPAKFIRYRFDTITINSLLASAWWTWPDHKIMDRIGLFLNTEDFVKNILTDTQSI
jgi:virginiamycin A acetyltransferase